MNVLLYLSVETLVGARRFLSSNRTWSEFGGEDVRQGKVVRGHARHSQQNVRKFVLSFP